MSEGGKIYGLMVQAMQEIGAVGLDEQAPSVVGGYKYRGIDAIRNAVHPLFARLGIFVMPTVLDSWPDTVEKIEYAKKQGDDDKVKVEFRTRTRVRITFYADDGSNVSAVVEGESIDSRDKGTMQSMSVAEKIAYICIFALPTGDTENEQNDDGGAFQRSRPTTPPAQTATDLDWTAVRAAQQKCGLDDEQLRVRRREIFDDLQPSKFTQDQVDEFESALLADANEQKKDDDDGLPF